MLQCSSNMYFLLALYYVPNELLCLSVHKAENFLEIEITEARKVPPLVMRI